MNIFQYQTANFNDVEPQLLLYQPNINSSILWPAIMSVGCMDLNSEYGWIYGSFLRYYLRKLWAYVNLENKDTLVGIKGRRGLPYQQIHNQPILPFPLICKNWYLGEKTETIVTDRHFCLMKIS